MNIMRVHIQTLSPVVLTAEKNSQVLTECQDGFSGSVLRGIFAQRYIQQRHLGKDGHKDESFRRLFFENLRFVQANLSHGGMRAIDVPMTLMKAKSTDVGRPKGEMPALLDLCCQAGAPGYKGMKGMAYVKDFVVRPVSVVKKITFHMSRESDDERLGGRSKEGKVYSYEAICEGQSFTGAVIGEEGDLKELLQGLNLQGQPFECQVGRSKFVQYGRCRIAVSAIEALPPAASAPTIYLRLDTPMIPSGGKPGDGKAAFQKIADDLNRRGSGFSIGDVFSAGTEMDGFVGIWQMKRPRQYGIKAGSVFALKKDGPWSEADKKAVEDLMYGGAGMRTEEGFGQLRQWKQGQPYKLQEGAPAECGFKQKSHRLQSEEVRRMARQIVMDGIKEKVKLKAFADAEQAVKHAGNVNCVHVFSRLENLLLSGGAGIGQDKFCRILQDEVRSGSPFEKYLHAIRIGHEELWDMLLEKKKDRPDEKYKMFFDDIPQALLQDIGYTKDNMAYDELFSEYWKWFFRHGRKQVGRKKDSREEQ